MTIGSSSLSHLPIAGSIRNFEHPVAPTSTTELHRQSHVQLEITIVGAGLGGLAAVIFIVQSGHNVIVYEAAREFAEVGAGLQLTPNCIKILPNYGFKDTFWSSGAEPISWTVHRYTGWILAHGKIFSNRSASGTAPRF